MLGSGAVMVMDETTDIVKAAWRSCRFFARESCGKCTPCREGTTWLERILARILDGHGRPERPRPAARRGRQHLPRARLAAAARRRSARSARSDGCRRSLRRSVGFRPEFDSALHRARPADGTASSQRPTCDPAGGRRVTDVAARRRRRRRRTLADHRSTASDARGRRPGELIIEAAERRRRLHPRFCYHARMEPVGMCRHVPRRGRRPAAARHCGRACMVTGRRRHEGRHRVADGRRRRRRACSSSCSPTTRSTARCATRAASARCRTRRSATAPARAGSSRRSGTSRSRSRSATSCSSTASAASCATAAPASPTRWPATR